MGFLDSRLFRLFQPSNSLGELNHRIDDLRYTLNSAIQDIAVLKQVLKEKGLMKDAVYQQLRIDQMVQDHSSAGGDSWKNPCFYPYTLDEVDFLREALRANAAEVSAFKENVASIRMLT
jgi:hypothetical protein